MNINDAEFLKKLRSTFKIEAYEHLRTISLSLMELENQSTDEEKKSVIEAIHREFHSLKGASRAVSIKEIETICHKIESIFSDIKKEKIILNIEMLDVFNEVLDTIEDILSLAEDEIKDISGIMRELTKIESGNLIGETLIKFSNLDEKPSVVIKPDMDVKHCLSKNCTRDVDSNINEKKHIDTDLMKNVEHNTDIEYSTGSNIDIAHKSIQEQNLKLAKIPEDKNDDIVRVSKAKLESVLLQGEEMVYAKLLATERAKDIRKIQELLSLYKKENNYSYVEALEKNIEVLLKSVENDAKTLETLTDTFIEDIKDIMLLPFSSTIEMFPKMVRDLSRQFGKEIEFISSGTEIEVDRRILEEIKNPLIHIIRNCIDHGIEKPVERKISGKPSKGIINLKVTQVGSDKIKIEISDDGAGINLSKVKEKVVKNRILTQAEVDDMDYENTKMLIFKSGISTSDIITDISGRGLGLAIVQEKIQKLEGAIKINTEEEIGTTFEITLPITISTNRGIIIKAAKQAFVIPTGKVEKVMRIKRDEIEILENRATILMDEHIIPVVELKDVLQIEEKKMGENPSDVIPILVVNDMEKKIAFSADEIITEQEVLVKRFNKQLKRVRNISGATILGSGDVVPILDVQDLIKSSIKYGDKSVNIVNSAKKDSVQKKSIIVVEDSITSRMLLKNILEGYGYIVKTAVDGLQGWKLIKSEKFDLVITDVEMPMMNGFELTEKIRKGSETSELPVILVTSLESREDKERGIDVGASAYIVKSDFHQSNLLEIIKRLI